MPDVFTMFLNKDDDDDLCKSIILLGGIFFSKLPPPPPPPPKSEIVGPLPTYSPSWRGGLTDI